LLQIFSIQTALNIMSFLVWSLSVCFVAVLVPSSSRSTSSSTPNILFILADDLGWGNVGWHQPNNSEILTPYMDALAQKGLILDRHYVHNLCSPTRSSFQSGRLPCHVNTEHPEQEYNMGIPENMTTIAVKMKQGGYHTHMVGKYDIGYESYQKLPTVGRGFDTFYGYLNGANDYWTEAMNNDCYFDYHLNLVDFWSDGQPAYGQNNSGVYEEYLFQQRVNELLVDESNSDSDAPFFLIYTPHLVHSPLQIPKEELMLFDDDESTCADRDSQVYPGFNNTQGNAANYRCRSIEESMVTLLDKIVGNITQTLQDLDLWDNTLVIFSSDNGGEIQMECCAGNNYPLRGGKGSVFEGGIRAAAFITGGYLPDNRIGKIETGMMHIADWYTTFCEMIGVDPFDDNADYHGLPPVDGVNLWPLISGENSTSPRIILPIDNTTLIQGNYKLIVGDAINMATWQGPRWPNASSPTSNVFKEMDCSRGCLFDLEQDMTEHFNIARDNYQLVRRMNATLVNYSKYFYANDDVLTESCPDDIDMECVCWMAVNRYDGYLGPYCNL